MKQKAQDGATTASSAPRRPLASGAALVGGLRLATLATNAAVSVIVARLLGPSGSGTFAIAAGLLATLVVFAAGGVDIGVTWMVAGRRWSPRSSYRTTQVAAAVLGLAGAAVGLAVYAFAADSLLEGLTLTMTALAVAGLPFALAVSYGSQVALALDRYEAAVGMPAALALAYVAIVAALASARGLEGAVMGLFGGQVVGGCVALWWGARRLPRESPRPGEPRGIDLHRLREALRFGVRPYLAAVLGVLTLRFDLFILNASAPRREVGYYAVAVALTNAIWLLPAALAGVLFPRLASLTGDDAVSRDTIERAETKTLRHTSLLLLVGGTAICAGILLLLEPIYGARFGPALGPALLLVPGALASGFTVTFYAALSGRGQPRYVLIGSVVTTVSAVALYLLMVPPLGADGAAIASSIAYILNSLLAGFFLQRVTGRPVLRRLWPGREELGDYRRLMARVGGAARGLM